MLSGPRAKPSEQSRESGAAAIVSVLIVLIAFSFAALTVDLGNVVARRGDTQTQVDFGALAGAPYLDGSNTRTASDPAVAAVAEYLFKNQPRDDVAPSQIPSSSAEIAADLVDADLTDGDLQFTNGGDRMHVIGPQSQVDFEFAGIFEMFSGPRVSNNLDITSDATILTGTPAGNAVFPMYVANPTAGNPACDYGLQTLTDPPGGQVVPPVVPTLYADGDTNDNDLTSLTITVGGAPASTVPSGSTNATITIKDRFKDATKVGFFKSNDPAAAPVEVARTAWVSPTGLLPYSSNNGSVEVTVPSIVSNDDILWYVRVYQGLIKDKWSARSEAQPMSVGDAPYECVGGASTGNFGTIKLPRSDSGNTQNASGWIARNIALGLQAPLSLDKYPGSPPPALCNSATPERVYSAGAPGLPKTNCVDTDTGLTASSATPGFIVGGAYDGRLVATASSADPDGSGGCSRDGTTGTTSPTNSGKQVNDDLLSCFLTNDTTQLGDVARRNYSGPAVFDPAIYSSPRFGWVPVFGLEATSGGSDKYSIVDFRGAFISDQPMNATKVTNAYNTGTENGLGVTGSGGGFKLQTLKVIFLNANSLPDGDAETPIGPNLGVGPIVTRLVD